MRPSCIRSAAPDTAFVRPTSKLLRTSTFRLALVYLALFAVSVTALLGFIYWNTARFVAEQTDETIRAEVIGLAEHYRETGLIGLVDVVRGRSRDQRLSLYLLTDPARRPLAGNLDAWPRARTEPDGWISFLAYRASDSREKPHHARALHLVLPGGFQLLVGRDIEARHELENRLRESLIWVIGLTLGLGIVGGLAMSRNMLRRIEAINRASRDIMAGHLGRRIAVDGSNDELDRLAQSLNAMLDQIERLMAGMRQVTDNVAHDLRSPLTRLRNRLEVTLMEAPSAEGYRAALEETIAEAEALLNTFNALLGIAEAESGAPREGFGPLNLGPLLGDVAELYRPTAEDKGLALRFEAGDGLAVAGDRHLLSQALANLVDNAVKYTPAGGTVTLAARRCDGAPEIIVTDTGPGVPEADRSRVFDRFVRLEASRNSPGSGLGLSLVSAVARLHGADVRLEDGAPGLRVRLSFPPAERS